MGREATRDLRLLSRGGAIFGYSEVALHLFELVVLLGFGVILATSLRARFARAGVAAAVPVLVIGTYYATVGPVQLGQVESLIGIPLYLTLWCATRASGAHPRRWLLAAGIAGGAALVFKLVLAPVVVAIWLVAVIPVRHEERRGRARRILTTGTWLVVGAAIPMGAVVAYLAAHGQLETARWTFFDVPRSATAIAGRPLERLLEGSAKTAARWAIPLALAIFGVTVRARRGWDRFDVGLAAWVVIGIPVFLVQHWWIYQYSMFLVPIGVFAAYGIEALADLVVRWTRPRRLALAGVAVVLAVPMGARVASNALDLATHGLGVRASDRAALRADIEPNYVEAEAWAAHLERMGETPDGVYVLGNPLNLYRANRPQSVAINGWSPEQYSAEVWQRLGRQIDAARPTELVVDDFSAAIMRARAPAVLALIHRLYRTVGSSGQDTWYRVRSSAR